MPDLDDIDHRLIATLRKDGRTPNKALAAELGIAETTVAARLRQLREANVMRVTLRRDIYSKGYDLQAFADIWVEGRAVDQVASDLAASTDIGSVSLLLGSPEITVSFNARNREDMLRVLDTVVAPIPGVSRVEVLTTLDIRKYLSGHGALTRR